jgi:hypothetical protein
MAFFRPNVLRLLCSSPVTTIYKSYLCFYHNSNLIWRDLHEFVSTSSVIFASRYRVRACTVVDHKIVNKWTTQHSRGGFTPALRLGGHWFDPRPSPGSAVKFLEQDTVPYTMSFGKLLSAFRCSIRLMILRPCLEERWVYDPMARDFRSGCCAVLDEEYNALTA